MKNKLIFWIFLFIFLSTYVAYENKDQSKSFFSIKEIEIKGVINSDRKEIVKKLGNLKKKKFNFFEN